MLIAYSTPPLTNTAIHVCKKARISVRERYMYIYVSLLLLCPGIYLPLLWEASFCWRSPVALAYTRGHFSALVSISSSRPSGAGAWPNRCGDCHVTYLPLVDSEGRLLPLHFLSEEEVRVYMYMYMYMRVCVCVCARAHSHS